MRRTRSRAKPTAPSTRQGRGTEHRRARVAGARQGNVCVVRRGVRGRRRDRHGAWSVRSGQRIGFTTTMSLHGDGCRCGKSTSSLPDSRLRFADLTRFINSLYSQQTTRTG
jgi:hypothetical protein